MDPSKIKLTNKSSEKPWSPKHERKKLKNRAGTRYSGIGTHAVHDADDKYKSWNPKKKKQVKQTEKDWQSKPKALLRDSIEHGKNPATGKPVKQTWGGLVTKDKTDKDEREY